MPEMKTWTANGTTFTLPFAPDGFGLGALSTPISDCNTALLSGFYKWDENCANSPFDYATMIVFGRYPGSCNQIAICNAGVNTGKVVSRTVAGTDITPWVRLDSAASAPAGYGLNNDFKTCTTRAQVDECKSSGWYRYVTADGTSLVPGFDFLYCGIRVDSYSTGGIIVQTAYNNTYYLNCFVRRYFTGGAWSEWEWENPPMHVDVEYRLTERWNGEPLYAKLVNIGAIPNTASTYVTDILPTNIKPLSISGIARGGTNNAHALPLPTKTIHVSVDGEWGSVYVSSDSDYSNYTGFLIVKYAKV